MFACTRNSITKIEEVKENRAGHFLFLSYLGGMFIFTGSNLYLVEEGENSGIWTSGRLDLLPSSLLKADHSIEKAICIIRSFCLYPMEFRTLSNSP